LALATLARAARERIPPRRSCASGPPRARHASLTACTMARPTVDLEDLLRALRAHDVKFGPSRLRARSSCSPTPAARHPLPPPRRPRLRGARPAQRPDRRRRSPPPRPRPADADRDQEQHRPRPRSPDRPDPPRAPARARANATELTRRSRSWRGALPAPHLTGPPSGPRRARIPGGKISRPAPKFGSILDRF